MNEDDWYLMASPFNRNLELLDSAAKVAAALEKCDQLDPFKPKPRIFRLSDLTEVKGANVLLHDKEKE